MTGGSARAELGLAALLILAALAVDTFWVRPAGERLDRLTARHAEARTAAPPPLVEASPADVETAAPAPEDSTAAVGDRRPVEILEAAQSGGGLVQRELRLLDRRDRGSARETFYYVEIYGAYRNVFDFLRRLETGRGQVAVDRFRMVTASGDPGVTLFLWASVLTPAA